MVAEKIGDLLQQISLNWAKLSKATISEHKELTNGRKKIKKHLFLKIY